MTRGGGADLLHRHGPVIGALTLAGLVAALALLLVQPAGAPRHQASTTLVVSSSRSSLLSDARNVGEDPIAFRSGPAETVRALVRTPVVLQPVIARLGLRTTPEQLAGRIAVSSPADGPVLEVVVTDDSGPAAMRIADAVARRLVTATDRLTGAAEDAGSLHVTLVRRAHETDPAGPDVVLTLAAGLLLGLITGLVATALREPRREPDWDRLAVR